MGRRDTKRERDCPEARGIAGSGFSYPDSTQGKSEGWRQPSGVYEGIQEEAGRVSGVRASVYGIEEGESVAMSILGLSTIPTLVIAALAVFRLAHLITKESGPFFFFWRMRKEAKKRGGSVEELAECPYCMGMWCSIWMVQYLAMPWRYFWIDCVIVILAVAGLAMLVHQVFTRLQK